MGSFFRFLVTAGLGTSRFCSLLWEFVLVNHVFLRLFLFSFGSEALPVAVILQRVGR